MQHHKTSTFIAARKNAARRATLTGTVQLLWPYIWPTDRADLKLRVFLAVALMLLSKLITIAIPYSYKWATDAVAGKLALDAVPMPRFLIGAAALTVLYGILRILMAFTQQGRDALFAAVAMNAVRRLAIEVFEHLHRLSLRFHLERKTGGLTRVLERGRNAIETIIRTSMLTAVPTIVEFALVVAAMLVSFDWRYVAAISVTVAAYLTYTTLATNWRIGIRRSMNESDTDANTKAIDSLLNFETVKYFGAESREAARYDKAMARYERMSVRTYVSLAVLNAGQAFIFTPGLIDGSGDVRRRSQKRNQDCRRLCALEPDHAATLPAAQFHGDGLSRNQTGDHRRRGDVRHPDAESRDRGPSRRAAAEGERRRGPVRECRVRL